MTWVRFAAMIVAGLVGLAPLIVTIAVLVSAPLTAGPSVATGKALLLSLTSACLAGVAAGAYGYALHLAAERVSDLRMMALSLALAVPILIPLVGTGLVGAKMLAGLETTGGAGWVILSHVLLGLPVGVFVIQRIVTSKTRLVLTYVQTLNGPAYRRHLYGFLPVCLPAIAAAVAVAALVAVEDATLAWYMGGTTHTFPILLVNTFRGVVGTDVIAGGALLFGLEVGLLYFTFRILRPN